MKRTGETPALTRPHARLIRQVAYHVGRLNQPRCCEALRQIALWRQHGRSIAISASTFPRLQFGDDGLDVEPLVFDAALQLAGVAVTEITCGEVGLIAG